MRSSKRACVCSILLALCFLCGCAPQDSFYKEVQANNYEAAIECYEEHIKGNSEDEAEAERFLQGYLQEKQEAFLADELGADAYITILRTLREIDDELCLLGYDLYDAEDLYDEITASRTAYTAAEECLQEKDYEGAIDAFADVSELDAKNYENAQQGMTEAITSYETEVREQIDEKIAADDYDAAKGLVDTAWSVLGGGELVEELNIQVLTAEALWHIEKAVTENKVAEAIEWHDYVLDMGYEIPAELSGRVEDIKSTYRQDVITRSVEAYKNEGYQSAVQIINEGLTVLTEDEKLNEYEELYHSCIPVELNELPVISGSSRYKEGTIEDRYGNIYQNYHDMNGGLGTEYQEFVVYLGREYSKFSGTYFAFSGLDWGNWGITFTVYADDIKIYDSGYVLPTEKANDFEIDVRNVEYLKLCVQGDAKMPLVNAIVYNTLEDSDFP